MTKVALQLSTSLLISESGQVFPIRGSRINQALKMQGQLCNVSRQLNQFAQKIRSQNLKATIHLLKII